VRASAAPFVWVTCPALVKRLGRDLELVGLHLEKDTLATVSSDCYQVIVDKEKVISGDLVLEDVCLKLSGRNNENLEKLFQKLAHGIERLVLVPDNHFSFLVETATEIQAQIKIDPETGTTVDGSLRYEELLPAETLMYCLLFFGDERISNNDSLKMKNICEMVTAAVAGHIQMGGDATLGRGIFAVSWPLSNDNGGEK
jgi:CRISPR-associated protein Cmr4